MSHSLLCETVTGRTLAELTRARDAADAADLVELRLDGVSDLDVASAMAGRRTPVIVTCRPTWEGGQFDGGEGAREVILRKALDLGAEYVDVEFKAGFDRLIAAHDERVIVSSHDFTCVPDDLASRVEAMRDTGAGVIKIAVTPASLTETLTLVDIANGGDAVVIGMGESGVPTRLLATKFGSRWTYAGQAVAPGQVPARRMLEQFRFRDVGPDTSVFGVIGAVNSPSPVMHNAAFAAAGIDAVCVPLRAADFADFLTFADAMSVVDAYLEDADSLPTLIARAERQFEWWTGEKPPAGIMRQAAINETGHRDTETRRQDG